MSQKIATFLSWLHSYIFWRGLPGGVLLIIHQVKSRVGRKHFNVSDAKIGVVKLRQKSSDLHVFRQVIVMCQYNPPRKQMTELRRRYENALAYGKLPLVIDAGANIGLFARLFISEFPEARIVCVEPDQNNMVLARENCKDFTNISFELAALWHESGVVGIANPEADSWAYSVEVTQGHDSKVNAITVDQIIEQEPNLELILIKADIEGAEKYAFPLNAKFWKYLPIIYVEPHDWLEGQCASMRQIISNSSYHDADFIVNGENILVFPSAGGK